MDLENKQVLEVFKSWFPTFDFKTRMEMLVSFRLVSNNLKEIVNKDFNSFRRCLYER